MTMKAPNRLISPPFRARARARVHEGGPRFRDARMGRHRTLPS